jgi:hypothetical protein
MSHAVALGPADERHLAHKSLEHPVRDRAGPPKRVELAFVLHRPKLFDKALPRHELEPAFAQLLGKRPREHVRLEADLALQLVCEPCHQRPLRQDSFDAVEGLSSLDVAEVRVEPCPVRLDEERSVRAVEAGQVEDIDEVRDEERLLEQVAEPVDPLAHAARSLR